MNTQQARQVAPGREGGWHARDAIQAVAVFGAVAYLAMRGGGYETVIREEFGLALWWLALVGLVSGLARPAGLPRGAQLLLAVVAALAVWTALGALWSPSVDRSLTEALRVLTLLGAAVAVVLSGGPKARRNVLVGVAAATAVIGLLALISRSIPQWFPEDRAAEFLPGTRDRLNYPLTYWNGLAALLAIGLPLLLHLAASRSRGAPIWAASMPVVGLAIFLTLSRGGTLAAIVAVVVVVALGTPRIRLLLTAANLTATTALLAWQSQSRDSYADALGDQLARDQGLEMLAWIAVAGAAAILIQLLIGRLPTAELGARLTPSPRARRRLTGLATAAAAAAVVWIIVSGAASDLWEEFRGDEFASNTAGAERLTSFAGNSRVEYWEASLDAYESEPVLGIGPGTWEFWWAQNGTTNTFARDAHALYLEALAELGPLGAALVLALVLGALAGLARRTAAEAREPEAAAVLAAATAFAVAAALDWAWEMTVVPAVFIALATAGLLRPARVNSPTWRPPALAVGALATFASAALLVSLLSGWETLESQQEARDGNLVAALESAEEAVDLRPFSPEAHLQVALVNESLGEFGPAARAARQAIEDEGVNWRNWYILARIQGARGKRQAAENALETARSLNPRSPLFTGGG